MRSGAGRAACVACAACAAAMVAVLASSPSWAVETRADVETDHLDAADDGGPRAFGVVVHPLPMATGWLGAELDAACASRAVVTVEGDGRWLFGGGRAYRASLGFALYPQRFSFHGIYVHPTLQWERAMTGGQGASALGGGATVGYAWTWPVGAMVRLGGGALYVKTLAGAGSSSGVAGLHPQVDGDVGWVF